jgi:hypothetical protein
MILILASVLISGSSLASEDENLISKIEVKKDFLQTQH